MEPGYSCIEPGYPSTDPGYPSIEPGYPSRAMERAFVTRLTSTSEFAELSCRRLSPAQKRSAWRVRYHRTPNERVRRISRPPPDPLPTQTSVLDFCAPHVLYNTSERPPRRER
eukprot:152747-Prorocentrum_minimum.AAC.1